MKIELTSELVNTILNDEFFASAVVEEDGWSLKRRFNISGSNGKIEVDVSKFTVPQLEALKALAIGSDNRGLSNRLASLINLKSNPMNSKIGSLKALPAGIVAFVLHNAIKGWLFRKEVDGTYMPWLVVGVDYNAGTAHQQEYVSVRMMANTAKHKSESSSNRSDINFQNITIHRESIYKKTIGELLDAFGLCKESPELHAQYEADLDTFIEYSAQVNCQFVTSKEAISVTDDGYYWSRNRSKLTIPAGHKLVNDEGIIERIIVSDYKSRFWESHDTDFDQVPYHCKLYVFNLNLHQHNWLHVSFIKPYEYKQNLKEKLVLPQTHHDLVEILASDMGFIMDDIIDGKSGGTTILCKGSPGLGKTLTAEVYSEVIQKPLYRVHSGQLGVSATDVEKHLNTVLTRAARWGAVMLIDEADVFIRQRGDGIQHNAVVAAFLRTLEYFSGLLFMTTNRQDDVDDAILSRCIAVIKYELPEYEDAKKIWKVLSTQFETKLSDELVSELAKTYSTASGRDIKELLKLTLKFCKGKAIEVDGDAFRRCAMFRGLI